MSAYDEEPIDPALESACTRVDFQLSYTRSLFIRQFHDDGITGATIDDAFNPGEKSDGSWSAGGNWVRHHDSDPVPTEQEWLQRFFEVAIQEAVHEVCEWFRIDGRVVLNPHGDHEQPILDESSELADRLWKMAHP